ncbi:uncharacterized protein CEXT_645281 [Caerostris extrusa]|uniref:Uncharacterized protein n=1 Tax=Caerostris extrusa TaxID=172846 RepID=A0AAV4SMN5_CAEEX|nr:uncharacterized protein CEXT_645281 [Caerostris extrusa]
MTVGIPELKVPVLDPFKSKKPVKVDVEDSKASVHGNFTDIHVEGLSGFKLDFLHADLQNLSLRFQLHIPKIKAVGNYTIDGKIIKIVPLRGNGEFRVESDNLSVSAKASMETSDDDHLQLSKDFDVEMDFDKVELHLENFLGGGRWTEVLLKILNDISKDLFKKCLPLLKVCLNKSLLKVINKHLMKLPITSIIPGSSANEYVDQILTNVQTYVRDHQLDPMKLPDFQSNFSKEIMPSRGILMEAAKYVPRMARRDDPPFMGRTSVRTRNAQEALRYPKSPLAFRTLSEKASLTKVRIKWNVSIANFNSAKVASKNHCYEDIEKT